MTTFLVIYLIVAFLFAAILNDELNPMGVLLWPVVLLVFVICLIGEVAESIKKHMDRYDV